MNSTTSCADPVSPLASMDQQSLVSRAWTSRPISRCTTDGSIHATAMGKANGRPWSKDRESERGSELTLSDAWLEPIRERLLPAQDCSAGGLVAEADRNDFGVEPPLRRQDIDGAPPQLKSRWRSWLIETLKRFCSQLAGG